MRKIPLNFTGKGRIIKLAFVVIICLSIVFCVAFFLITFLPTGVLAHEYSGQYYGFGMGCLGGLYENSHEANMSHNHTVNIIICGRNFRGGTFLVT